MESFAPCALSIVAGTMIREGACHCRALRIECRGEPAKVSLCNCRDCQRRTGSLFSVAAFFPREAVRTLAGETMGYRRPSASGFAVTFHSCVTCGSAVWWEPDRMPHLIGVAAGCFADPDFPMPVQAVWAEDKHKWLELPAAIPLHPRNPPSSSTSPAPSFDCTAPVIATYEARHFDGVDALWRAAFPGDPPWNRAHIAIPEKLRIQPDLFLVAEAEGVVVGTAMAGYDGHRGWLYAVAVAEGLRRSGIGSALIEEAETRLRRRGCQKINLQIREGNEAVAAFYRRHGYAPEARMSMGKRLDSA